MHRHISRYVHQKHLIISSTASSLFIQRNKHRFSMLRNHLGSTRSQRRSSGVVISRGSKVPPPPPEPGVQEPSRQLRPLHPAPLAPHHHHQQQQQQHHHHHHHHTQQSHQPRQSAVVTTAHSSVQNTLNSDTADVDGSTMPGKQAETATTTTATDSLAERRPSRRAPPPPAPEDDEMVGERNEEEGAWLMEQQLDRRGSEEDGEDDDMEGGEGREMEGGNGPDVTATPVSHVVRQNELQRQQHQKQDEEEEEHTHDDDDDDDERLDGYNQTRSSHSQKLSGRDEEATQGDGNVGNGERSMSQDATPIARTYAVVPSTNPVLRHQPTTTTTATTTRSGGNADFHQTEESDDCDDSLGEDFVIEEEEIVPASAAEESELPFALPGISADARRPAGTPTTRLHKAPAPEELRRASEHSSEGLGVHHRETVNTFRRGEEGEERIGDEAQVRTDLLLNKIDQLEQQVSGLTAQISHLTAAIPSLIQQAVSEAVTAEFELRDDMLASALSPGEMDNIDEDKIF